MPKISTFIIKKMTTVKRTNTEEEVHFERRDKELSLSTEDVTLQPCKIIKRIGLQIFFFGEPYYLR